MSARYTQSKSEQAAHAAILKGMLKQPENRLCADCKRNDPRWASCNLGCFICIRCSGVHRGMGVHISRIKSVDLDTWTPEQIKNVQRWGNKRANAYWEAHLKPGHIPPEHKIESFIRSKYDTKRWALEGPIPEPETLDNGNSAAATASPSVPSQTGAQLGQTSASAALPRAQATMASGVKSTSHSSDLFDLDFSEPASSSSSQPKAAMLQSTAAPARADKKADILSLFAAPSASGARQSLSAAPIQAAPASVVAPSANPAAFGSAQTSSQSVFDAFGDFSSATPGLASPQSSNAFTAFETAPNVWEQGSGQKQGGPSRQPDAFSDIWS